MDGGTGMKPKKQWDHKWYTEEFLQQLKATAAVETMCAPASGVANRCRKSAGGTPSSVNQVRIVTPNQAA